MSTFLLHHTKQFYLWAQKKRETEKQMHCAFRKECVGDESVKMEEDEHRSSVIIDGAIC